jgi:hypothetical protein
MTQTTHNQAVDNSRKSILALGCDPFASPEASSAIPPLVGNPEYIPTTTGEEFFEQLRSRSWSVVFLAPGACRFSAAERPIPGGNSATAGWTLEQYREVVHAEQGEDIPIVETLDERETVRFLAEVLAGARETSGAADSASVARLDFSKLRASWSV